MQKSIIEKVVKMIFFFGNTANNNQEYSNKYILKYAVKEFRNVAIKNGLSSNK